MVQNVPPSQSWLRSHPALSAMLAAALLLAACAPAQPTPTAAPAKPAAQPTAAPAKPTAAPAAKPAEAKPTAAPAAKPAAKVDTREVENFYRDKTIRVIVGSAPGGGYDTYARAIARHIGKHIPGNPNVIVENLAGAGSLRAANHVYNVAEKDGTIIGHIQGGLFLQQLMGREGIEFDAVKWQFIGVPVGETATCWADKRTGITSVQDIMGPQGKQYIAGGNAPGSATWDIAMRLRHALNLNIKMVDGYDGTAPIRLAAERGEVDGICGQGYSSLRSTSWDKVESGDYVVFLQLGEKPQEGLEKVPTAISLAQTDEARQIIRLGIDLVQQVQRPFLVAPGVPQERVLALRNAFMATIKDPQFLQDAERAQLELDPVPGDKVQELVEELFQMPAPVKEKLELINDRKL